MEGEQLAARHRRATRLDGKGGGRGRRARLVRHQGLCVGQIEPLHTMEMEQAEYLRAEPTAATSRCGASARTGLLGPRLRWLGGRKHAEGRVDGHELAAHGCGGERVAGRGSKQSVVPSARHEARAIGQLELAVRQETAERCGEHAWRQPMDVVQHEQLTIQGGTHGL